MVQRVTVCRGTQRINSDFKFEALRRLQLVSDGQLMAALLTGGVCRFESLLSFGQEAAVGPVQHGFDLVVRIIRLAGSEGFLCADAGHLCAIHTSKPVSHHYT